MEIIKTNQLSKYYGSDKGIEGIELQVMAGEFYGFIGPNGAGKSTLIRTLLNLIYPTDGEAKIFGLDIVSDTKAIKQRVGYLPSDVNFYNNMKVREMLDFTSTFFPNTNKAYRDALCERFALDTSRELNDLSLGNKKKVAIVQSLMHKPELLIMDEPTNGLDPLMQNEFHEAIKEANNQGTTVFFSSHILGDVQKYCDKVSIIRKGELIATENITQLLAKQLKKVQLVFKEQPNEAQLKLDGISDLGIFGKRVVFTYAKDPSELIKILSDWSISDVNIVEPTLEDIFIHYYE